MACGNEKAYLIRDLLRGELTGGATSATVAEHACLTNAGAHRILRVMVANGLAREETSQHDGRGRPNKVYTEIGLDSNMPKVFGPRPRQSEQSFGDGLPMVSSIWQLASLVGGA